MKGPIAASLLALSSVAYAQVSKKCQNGVCFSLNIPDATASSGTGDIFFQITAPTSMQWVALGQGSGMNNANMFVVYTAAGGTNVTVSPRLGVQHNEPDFNSKAVIEMLAGSGVTDGSMIANVKCSTCTDWDVGTQSFSSSAGDWIWAYKSGDALNTNDQSASISEHDEKGSGLDFDFSAAKGGSSSNPFVTSSGSSSGGSGTTSGSGSGSTATKCTPRSGSTNTASSTSSGSSSPSGPGGWGGWGGQWGGQQTGTPGKRQTDSNDDDCETDTGSSSSEGFGSNQGLSASKQTQLLMAHGILACLAFAILFPMGAIAIRLLSFPGIVMLHAAIQVVSYILFIVAFGIGVYLANNLNELNEYHPIIGIILFVLIFFQAILGALHHRAYKKYQRRTLWSHGHLWLGRIVITLGIINGGLGFLLADNTKSGAIAYGVIAGIVWLVYVASAVVGEMKRSKTGSASYDPPKYEEVPPRPSETRGGGAGNDVPLEYYGNRHPTT